MHQSLIDSGRDAIARVLETYMTEYEARERANNISFAGGLGEKLTPKVIAAFLVPSKAKKGIADDMERARVSIELARIWIIVTAESAQKAYFRLHKDTNMTRKAAAKYLLDSGISGRIVDSIIRKAYGDHGRGLPQCIQKIERMRRNHNN